MKLIATFLFLTMTSAFASDVCKFGTTYEIFEASERGEVNLVQETTADRLSKSERKMVIDMLKRYSSDFGVYESDKEAMNDFADIRRPGQTEPGSNAGMISYYLIGGKKIALVQFYPGDNEYGSIYEVKTGGTFQFIVRITDGEIFCE